MKSDLHLARLIQSFFDDYLRAQRGVSPHTMLAYRDALKLCLQFAARRHGKEVARLHFTDLDAATVLAFLRHLETERGNSASTRNHRLIALHRFFAYAASVSPEWTQQCAQILAIPLKRTDHSLLGYLEPDELRYLFDQVNAATLQGRRDLALLRVLYNTGARAQEVIDLRVGSVQWARPYQVRLLGKGRKERICPLWPETVTSLRQYLEARGSNGDPSAPLFLNQHGQRLTRFGLHYLIRKYAARAAQDRPALNAKHISPHTFRHTTAMHLLQSGVELNVIRAWLGHSSLETTSQYIEVDLAMKRRAIEACEPHARPSKRAAPWQRRQDILAWLESL